MDVVKAALKAIHSLHKWANDYYYHLKYFLNFIKLIEACEE